MVRHPHCPPVSTLVELLRWRAEHQGDQLGYTHLVDGESQTDTRTWAALDRRARAVAAWLQARGAAGSRVLLMVEEGNLFLDGLFGCIYAGALAVPVHPPDSTRLHRTLPRLRSICRDAEIAFVLSSAEIEVAARPHLAQEPVLAQATWLALDDLDDSGADAWVDPERSPEDLAYLQYTSGSTATPKGVMISHHNLLHQLADFDVGYDHSPASVLVSWLPATHDLGLVYGRLMALFIGFHCVSMSPVAFMQRPLRWLLALDHYRGTHTPSPNFGLEVVARKTTAGERAALDLSCVQVVLNGAEPIRQASEELFVQALRPSGLRAAAVTHAMGMSESTAKIVTEPVDREPARFLHLDSDAYEDHRVVLVDRSHPRARTVASCGRTVLDTRAWIVDPESLQHLGEDRVGELWVSGTTVAQGYWNNPEATAATFGAHTADGQGPFLRTGDLAFARDGEIFLTGRLKDLIIVRGQNHHPQDIEWTVTEAVAALRPNCAAAFGIASDGVEQLVLVAEVHPDRIGDPEAVFGAIRAAIFEEHGLQPATIALLAPRALPKTSSGKIQRTLARERFVAGDLETVARWDAAAPLPASAPEPAVDLRERLARASGRRRHGLLAQAIAARVAELLGLKTDEVERDRPLMELGLDSVTAVELVEAVGRSLGERLDGTALFDHPTVDALADWLIETVPLESDAESGDPEAAARAILGSLDEL